MHLQQNELEIYIFAMFKFVFMQFFGRVESKYTAVSINVVGLKHQAYQSRPNGGMGIYLHLHFCTSSICLSFLETFLVSFLSLLCGRIILFKMQMQRKLIFSSHV